MKKIHTIIAALAAFTACQEIEPVTTFKYAEPAPEKTYTKEEALDYCLADKLTTIAELAAKYNHGNPFEMQGGMIAGRVSTTDQPGNFYKTLYIQDETGGLELKIGRNGLYNDYLPGQTLYVSLEGLFLGEYGYKTGNYGGNGMVQIGFDGAGTDYETSYLQVPFLIQSHILKGSVEDIQKVTPAIVAESDLPGKDGTLASCKYIGQLVTLKGLKYADENFCLLYINSKQNKKAATNRIFLSDSNPEGDKPHHITTWAMSKEKMTELISAGYWDAAKVGSGNEYAKKEDGSIMTVADFKADGTYPGIEKNAYSISQYFKMGSKEIQIRTSGFCKFSDKEIPTEVLNGTASLDVTGILTLYQGSIQLTVNNISDFVVNGQPLK